MQCISTSGRLALPIRGELERLKDTHGNLVRDTVRGLTAQFEPASMAPEHMREAVSRLPAFGRGVGLNEDPYRRCGFFDSHHAQRVNDWTDEDRELVEETLASLPENGVDFLIVEAPKVAAPWPKYDSARSVGSIVSTVEQIGVDPQVVIDYERQNRDRAEVVEAMQRLIDGQVSEAQVPDGPVEVQA